MTKSQEQQILQNSITTVINTTIQLLKSTDTSGNEELEEMYDINITDWEDLKSVVDILWLERRGQILAARMRDQKS